MPDTFREGLSPKKPQRDHINRASRKTIRNWQYHLKRWIPCLEQEGFTVVVEDEAFLRNVISDYDVILHKFNNLHGYDCHCIFWSATTAHLEGFSIALFRFRPSQKSHLHWQLIMFASFFKITLIAKWLYVVYAIGTAFWQWRYMIFCYVVFGLSFWWFYLEPWSFTTWTLIILY